VAPKREDLAKRFDKRLKQAPARGAIVATQVRATPTRWPSRPAPAASRATPSTARPRPAAELRLDLSDRLGRDVSYKLLWGSALLLWVRSR